MGGNGRQKPAGYSGKPLVAKLGIRPEMRIAILQAPRGYERTLGTLPPVRRGASAAGPLDFVQYFTTAKRELERRFAALVRALAPAGMLWISWPKRASGVATDLTEDVIRVIGVAHGLVDVKVAAVDDVWSGLKFVRRLKDR
jgi:hypothetical protein